MDKYLVPVTYLGKKIGLYNTLTKIVTYDDINEYNKIVTNSTMVGVSSRSIGNINTDNLVVNDEIIDMSLIVIKTVK